jgi:hydroxymethylglutaryl-CoA synthase
MTNIDQYLDVGIDSAAFYTSKYYVDLRDLAKSRGVDPNKYLKGLLTHEMRIPAPGEDIVSMSIKAGQHALIKGNIDPKEIEAVFIGTETSTYAAKSVSNVISEVLGVSRNSMTVDMQAACASGTLALLNAIGLINSGIINKALVIAVDISTYGLGSPGEPTQGMGAVAMVISKNPRIARFSRKFGKVSGNINDFYRLPNDKHPTVVGKYSVDSYIRLQQEAMDDFLSGISYISPDYYIFHSPFAKLPVKNIQNLLKNRWEKLQIPFIENHISPNLTSHLDDEFIKGIVNPVVEYLEKQGVIEDVEYTKYLISSNLKRKMFPTLRVPMSIGNMYSASVWAQIVYFVENLAKVGDQIYFGSYGSGAVCISGMLEVMPEFENVAKKPPVVIDYLQSKTKVSIEDYELIHEGAKEESIYYAKIEPIIETENKFVEINVCEQASIVPKIQGLDYCPDSEEDPNRLKLPLYGRITSHPIKANKIPEILSKNMVPVSPEVTKGQLVEYGMKRTSEPVKVGYFNWIPTYKPIPHSLIKSKY